MNNCRDIETSLYLCVRSCRSYFSDQSTKEILDELHPQLNPFQSDNVTMKKLSSFLPINLPSHLHSQGFKYIHFEYCISVFDEFSLRLWLNEYLDIWENLSNCFLWSWVSLFQ